MDSKPMLGATFVPGGFDDDYYYPPEVVSPMPQRYVPQCITCLHSREETNVGLYRIMPEVPSNMQEELANLELNAQNQGHRLSLDSNMSSQSPYVDTRGGNTQSQRPGPGFTASYEHTNASAYQNINQDYQQFVGRAGGDSPKFSPFPKLQNPGPNVPLSDEDKEEVLERARHFVLKSTDPEMQLAWAQDALSWVEVASQSASRYSEGQQGRSVTPKVEHQLREDALNIVRFLADQSHPKAEFMKAMWLEFGKFGYRVDKKEAFLGYKRSAEKGYARAEYRIGMQYESSNNATKAIEHYRKGVALKDSASNYRLGMMTLLGQHGMPMDYQRGVDLVRFAADTADENAPQGAYVYGMLLARELPNISIPDQFLEFDLNDAKLFIEKAAYLGFAKAQLKMGQAYELCQLGCEFEPALSLHYNALAARQGDAEAEMAISKWFLCGFEGVFEKNEELAFTYAHRAAQTKLPTAEFAMGYFYEIGMYVSVDLRESERWYQMASEHGNKDAIGRIDSIRKNNTLSKQDHEQIAISRIKSQYGSQRGGRPERFKQKPAPMPVMTEGRADMPDHRSSYAPAPLRPQKDVIQRPSTVAPYPEDDMPRLGAGYGGYGNQGLKPTPRNGPPADRPSSAFGIRPIQHANTEMQGQGSSLRPNEPIRPSSSMANMTIPNGGRGRGDQISSATGWEPQIPTKYNPNQQSNIPKPDLGRPTNFDQGGPNRLQKPMPPQTMNKVQPQPPPASIDSSYSRPSTQYNDPAMQRRDPAANQYNRPERLGSAPPQSSTTPLKNPPQQRPHDAPQNPSRTSQRPPQHTMSSQSSDSRPSSAAPPVPSSTYSSGPPKKSGPATFEEMGIPAGKNESDCVSHDTLCKAIILIRF
jgi:TPR repeat protein